MAQPPEKKDSSLEDIQSENTAEHAEKTKRAPYDDLEGIAPDRLNAVFENPLASIAKEDLLRDVTEFCAKFNLTDHLENFKKGALVSQNPSKVDEIPELTDDDRYNLKREITHKWSQPFPLYWLAGTQ
jgi:hypothetical protein